MIRRVISIDAQMYEDLRAKAKNSGLSISALMRLAIMRMLRDWNTVWGEQWRMSNR